MLKKRLIPKMLIKNLKMGSLFRESLVTTRLFDAHFVVGDPVSQAKIYEAQFADELIVLNIDRTEIASNTNMLKIIENLAAETFMPVCAGGGVKSLDDFETLLSKGADKVSLNSTALQNPNLISLAASRYGSQCVVVSIDFKQIKSTNIVMTDRGSLATNFELVSWARKMEQLGAGELLICDVDRDGSGEGLNYEACMSVVNSVDIPVILSGGCGLAEHFVQGFVSGGADGIASGTFFSFRDQNLMQTRSHIRNAGIPIRMET